MKSNKKIIVVIGVILLLALGGVVGSMAFKGGGGKNDADSSEEEYVETAKSEYDKAKEANVKDADDPYDTQIDFEGLKAINPDVIAWIKIPGTNIDYPVLQNMDQPDDYYLNRTMEGQEGLPGSIYMEKYDSATFTNPVTVMYGHTLHDGTMFSELKKYTERDFFDENSYIYIYLPDGMTKKYQIFAAVAFDDRYLMTTYAFFAYQDEVDKFVSDLKGCLEGNIDENIELGSGKTIITLSTCIDEFPDQRWLVNAVLVEEK